MKGISELRDLRQNIGFKIMDIFPMRGKTHITQGDVRLKVDIILDEVNRTGSKCTIIILNTYFIR